MPSHKHKKRKKSHKNQKRQVSTSSDSEDNTSNRKQASDSEDGGLMPSQKRRKTKNHKRDKRRLSLTSDCEYGEWKVKFGDSPSDSDESQGEERLTSLVRRSYMNHLQQALTQNLKSWRENCNEFSEESIHELSSKFSSVLEQKALRACMVSEVYRKNMVSMIRQIKGNANDGRLFIEENGLSKLKLKLPLNKAIQTDSISVNARRSSTVETQTEPPFTSLLELPLPKTIIFPTSPTNRPYDPADVTSSIGSKAPGEAEQDVCSITSTSDLCNPEWQQPDPNSSAGDTNVMNRKINDHMNCNVDYEKRTNIDPCSTKDNLDLRISAIGLQSYVDRVPETSPSESTDKSKTKSNWFAEEIAQSCNLTRVLLKMSTKQRERVLKKIKELFGEDDQPLTELTEKNIAICRKRIASVVVMELTPIYQGKRIASRYLFKFVAKQITKSLMEESYAPDTRSIRQKVRAFFTDGRVIMSESDCI